MSEPKVCKKCYGYGHQGEKRGCKYCGAPYIDFKGIAKEATKKRPKPRAFPVYIAMGACGDYEDHRDWIVEGYMDQQEAQKRRCALQEGARVLLADLRQALDEDIECDMSDRIKKLDPSLNEYLLTHDLEYFIVTIKIFQPKEPK